MTKDGYGYFNDDEKLPLIIDSRSLRLDIYPAVRVS